MVPGAQTGSAGEDGAKEAPDAPGVEDRDEGGDAGCAGALPVLRPDERADAMPRILASAATLAEAFGSGFMMLTAGIDAALGKSASITIFFWPGPA